MSEKVKRITKQYTKEYKAEAVKLVREIGTTKAAIELGVPKSTLSQWVKRAEIGDLDTGIGTQTPGSAMTQAMEIQQLRAEIKALVKENARIEGNVSNFVYQTLCNPSSASKYKLTRFTKYCFLLPLYYLLLPDLLSFIHKLD